jgi:1-acyl-sn-glycerol-3-phosphate acyltransferase
MFDDIRPYNDDEVVAVIRKLVNEKELQSSVASYTMPRLYRWLPGFSRLLVKFSLKSKLRKISDVASMQKEVAKYLFRLIRTSTKGFSHSGLQAIDLSKPTLFISNHRDIVLDPALVNLALFEVGASTVEIAIGDNLLSKVWISDLMRLNKSFIVKRGEKNKRAMLAASKHLSAYVHHALVEKKQHIWIAQKEGRAKDGLDKTNSALISMLLLNKAKETSIAEYLLQLNIVPISISYEFDPCDTDKARELAIREATGSYQKAEDEDIRSITKGLTGYKGRIHLAFGEPIAGDFADSKAIATAIDKQVIGRYQLFDTNQVAYQQIKSQSPESTASGTLHQRLAGLTEAEQRWLLTMYANPVAAKKDLKI